MIDVHAQLDFKEFDYDRDEVINRFFRKGGLFILNIGTSLEGSQKGINIAQSYPRIFASVGIHPHWVNQLIENKKGDFKKVEEEILKASQTLKKLSFFPKVKAIGECGLDYFYQKDQITKHFQKKLFEIHLKLAQKRKLPLIIHCRKAYNDLLEIILNQENNLKIKILLHCYEGDFKITQRFLNIPNLYFSFCGNITFFKNQKAEIFKVIKKIPQEKILAETDCPFLAPTPFRGRRNEPVFMEKTIEKLAEIKSIEKKVMENLCDKNSLQLFEFE